MDKQQALLNAVSDWEVERRLKEADGDTGEAIRSQLQRATRISTKVNLEKATESLDITNNTVIYQPTDEAGKPLHHYVIRTNPDSSRCLSIKVSFEIVDHEDV